jgi:hypothetical protein
MQAMNRTTAASPPVSGAVFYKGGRFYSEGKRTPAGGAWVHSGKIVAYGDDPNPSARRRQALAVVPDTIPDFVDAAQAIYPTPSAPLERGSASIQEDEPTAFTNWEAVTRKTLRVIRNHERAAAIRVRYTGLFENRPKPKCTCRRTTGRINQRTWKLIFTIIRFVFIKLCERFISGVHLENFSQINYEQW